jgi:raffinose/stachyose/melibiose transport system substrate-binding protein
MNGEISWTSQPFIDAVDKLKEWWDKGYFGKYYHSFTMEQAFATLSDGTAAMAPTGTWSFQYIPIYFKGREDEVGFVGFPSAEGLSTPLYMLSIGSTFSIANNSSNPYGAARAIDFMFSDDFYGKINTVWQGEWNMPLRDLSKVIIGENVIPQYRSSMVNLANAVSKNQYGYTTWTFMPPATSNYVHSGIEEVWFDAIDSGEFLAKIDKLFQEEKAEGKVPPIPER